MNKTIPPRIIKTARSSHEINAAARNGVTPLVKKLEPSKELHQTYGVFQNRKTKEIEVAEGYTVYSRNGKTTYDEAEWELVIPFFEYYPYQFESFFAAYLIPSDIVVGERVIIEDQIEDFYGGTFWSHNIRLKTLEAIWDGSDLLIQYQRGRDDVCNMVG